MPVDGENQPKTAANSVQARWQDAVQPAKSHGLWGVGGAQIVKNRIRQQYPTVKVTMDRQLSRLSLFYSIFKFLVGSTPLKSGKKYNWLFPTSECFGGPPFLASLCRL
jgi:hypothetical protein